MQLSMQAKVRKPLDRALCTPIGSRLQCRLTFLRGQELAYVSDAGMEMLSGRFKLDALKREAEQGGYRGEKVVFLERYDGRASARSDRWARMF